MAQPHSEDSIRQGRCVQVAFCHGQTSSCTPSLSAPESRDNGYTLFIEVTSKMTSILFLMISGLGWNLLLSCSTTSVTSCLCFSYFLLFIILKGYILNITTKKEITSTNLTMQDSIFCFSTYPPSSSSHSSLVCLTLPGTGYSNTCEDIDPKLNLSLYLLYLHSVKS